MARDGTTSGSKDPDQRPIGVGFTVSRKVGNAVARNRARRRLRAAALALLPAAGAPGEDYVLIGRKTTLTRPYADLLADLSGALAGIERKRQASPSQSGANQSGANRSGASRSGRP